MRTRSSEHYRNRAEELRAASENMKDESARVTLLDLARQYEEMARRARAQTLKGREPEK